MKVALATGAGNRLGRELALGLGRAGYTVAIHFRSRREDADETLRLLSKQGSAGAVFEADFRVPRAAGALVASVLEKFGRLDALLHAASPWIERPLAEMSEDDWDASFSVGPKTAFFLAQAAESALRASRGSILLVGDVAAMKAWPKLIPHCAAKAAINSLVMNLAVALGPEVRVNGIAPGVVLPPEGFGPEKLARIVERTPLKRRVEVSSVVDQAMSILANEGMTGQVVAVDAGLSVV